MVKTMARPIRTCAGKTLSPKMGMKEKIVTILKNIMAINGQIRWSMVKRDSMWSIFLILIDVGDFSIKLMRVVGHFLKHPRGQ